MLKCYALDRVLNLKNYNMGKFFSGIGRLIHILLVILVIFIFGSSAWDAASTYFKAETPLSVASKTEPLSWNLVQTKSRGGHKRYSLQSGKYDLKVCEDTSGYIECSRFLSKRVPGLCPAPSAAAAGGEPAATIPCQQSLGRRFESEPLVVGYNGKDLVSVSTPGGAPILSPAEGAAMYKSYVQREAMLSFGFSLLVCIFAVIGL